ncbi:membrane protein insertion efficiency factor YidD [Catellatospora bangladeshensis]|uniref:Membrane protein insertion efficiency factor YidD n=1 Tax=Catellatospora bangladeshensis TaxID=310355 RepID=A0A8J3JPJ1_9ACTN|nr:membrane protein insertion efficiency factor YidD [Catellatospora bangladeshensis]GIF82620.1 hypothetical protein Cba03nite_39690 [Catellatospora bangladeshensis]
MPALEPPFPACFACCPGGMCCGGGVDDLAAWAHLPEVALRAVAGLFTAAPADRQRQGVTARFAENLIREYQLRISARTAARCRFSPSCSAFGLEAVRRHGAWTGTRLIWQRLSRCRTTVAYGTADPVPVAGGAA